MPYEIHEKLTREFEYLTELQRTESERSAVLSVACFLEDRLRELLDLHSSTPDPRKKNRAQECDPDCQCNCHNKRKKDRRPQSFADMISEARARRLLAADVLHDIETIRDIRNAFGHTLASRSLQYVAASCERLQLPDASGEAGEASTDVRARHRFNISARRTIEAVLRAILHEVRRVLSEQRELERARATSQESGTAHG